MLGIVVGAAILLTAAWILFRKIRVFSRSGCGSCPYCGGCRAEKKPRNKKCG